jgi:hypothetical protein
MSAPFTQAVVLDFETAWGRKVGLGFSCQTTEEYIRDPRFKAWGLSWKWLGGAAPAQWVPRKNLPKFFASIDWSKTAVLAQNAMFDVSIMAWHYDSHPAFVMDTLSMGRALRGVEVGNSLAKLAASFGLPEKGKGLAPSENILDELPPEVEEQLADYCCHDTWLCEQIFFKLGGWAYPRSELRLIDMTLKMFTRPQLVLDSSMLVDALHEEREKREGLLQRLGVDEAALASNPQFAEVLRSLGIEPPIKKSKTTGKSTLALAKNDALFQALLNGDNEDVAALCEARLKVKSTTERTRAQRFLDISRRGTLPVPLSYYGAKSGRWTAAKGSAINMQNLKRGSFLRKAIMAPEGHQLVVGDLSQIEPRVLAWLADYEDMLLIFRQGGDPYAAFGAQMFNVPGLTKESHPDLRQSAKSALLGCFGPNTPVLTNRGWVPIVRVQATDTVWDGEEWVCHQGVVPQGEKEVLTAAGISATSDHEILTEHGWVEWSAALANRSLLKSALLLGSSPVSVGAARQLVDSILLCSAPVGGQGLSTATTLLQGALLAAMPALKERLSRLDGNKKGTTWSALIDDIVTDCWIALAPSSLDAQTRIVPCTQTTEGAELPCTKDGLRTALSSFVTSLGLAAGIDLNSSSTESTTTGGMNPATCDSSAAALTWPTNDASLREKSKPSDSGSPPLKQRMQTYDIAYAGPRNRYTVLTWYGPIIVHNCGYGLGWASFASQLLVGFLGAPPVRYDKEFAKKLGVTGRYIEAFLNFKDNEKKLLEIPHICTDEELLVHAVAAKMIIDKYRATAYPVVAFWNMCGELLTRCLAGGDEVVYKCLTFKKEEIVLPNGMSLLYPDLRQVKDKETGSMQWVYGEDETKLYPGKITNNVVQGTARIVMTDGMLRVSKKYPIVGTVHDELIAVVPDKEVADAKTWVLAQMTMEPKYLPGIPLDADGGAHRRYGLAKN